MYLCTHSPLAQAFGTSLFLLSVKTSTHINPKADKGQRNIIPWLHGTPAYASFFIPAFCVTISVPAQRRVLYHVPICNIQVAGTFGQRYLSALHLESLYKCLVQKMQYSLAFFVPHTHLWTRQPFKFAYHITNVPSTLLLCRHSSSMSVWTDIFSPYVSNISCIYPVILHTPTTAIPLLWLQDWTIVLSISQWQGV